MIESKPQKLKVSTTCPINRITITMDDEKTEKYRKYWLLL